MIPRKIRRPFAALLLGGAVIGIFTGLEIQSGSAASLTLTAASLTSYRTCVLSATPASTTVVADAEIRQDAGTTNFGSATTLSVTSSGVANGRTYLRFDLTSCAPLIPTSATIRLATLRLYVTALPAACRTFNIFRVGSAWAETGITWNNQPFGTSLNNPATAARTDSFDVGTSGGCENRTNGAYVVGAEVTPDVAAYTAGSATNQGWMIRDNAEAGATARTVTMSAKELGTLAQVPQLVISYVISP